LWQVTLAAMALFFVLIQRTKDQVSREASLPHKPSLQNRQNLGARFYAFASPQQAIPSEKPYNALQSHILSIVLLVFGRTYSADK